MQGLGYSVDPLVDPCILSPMVSTSELPPVARPPIVGGRFRSHASMVW